MDRIFIAHAEEDFALVSPLVKGLESNGFRCWYYEQNSLAGHSYLAQVHEAICSASVVLVLVSEFSLRSEEVSREVELAHKKNKPFIPVLRNVSSKQLESQRPSWYVAFGTMVHIDYGRDRKALLAEVLKAARSFNVQQRPAPMPSEDDSPNRTGHDERRLGSTPLWASDGTQIDPSRLSELVYEPDIVKQFVNSDHKLFICGTKGLGKTLLLRFKRFKLSEQHAGKSGGSKTPDVLFIPVDRPYLDMMTDLPTLAQNHHEFLSHLRNCKRLWGFAIRLSIISHIDTAAWELLRVASDELPPVFLAWLEGVSPDRKKGSDRGKTDPDEPKPPISVEPSIIFKELLRLPVREINRLLDRLEGRLDQVSRSINRAVHVFIDKVDQGVSELTREAWSNVQAGLLEAAWDFSSTNAHVKVFGTIRDEAYANYESPIKANLRGATVMLKYTPSELRQLIDGLAAFYEGASDFSSFVRLSTVRNTRADVVEDSFQYVMRHTVGRPRDLVHLCSALSALGEGITERDFRRTINEAAAGAVVATLFVEMAAFLDCLKTAEERARFFRILPYNILTRQEVRELSRRFNRLDTAAADAEALAEAGYDPFLELWSCGLLGCVEDDLVDDASTQRFKQPHDSFRADIRRLPESPYYLLHPALQTLVKQQRAGDGYEVFKFVVVGNDYKWHRHDAIMIDLQRELFKMRGERNGIREVIESALPYLHAAWSEKKDLTEYLPREQWERLEDAALKADEMRFEPLCQALKAAWVDWGNDSRRRQARKAKAQRRR